VRFALRLFPKSWFKNPIVAHHLTSGFVLYRRRGGLCRDSFILGYVAVTGLLLAGPVL
jgi:hypothetical protein